MAISHQSGSIMLRTPFESFNCKTKKSLLAYMAVLHSEINPQNTDLQPYRNVKSKEVSLQHKLLKRNRCWAKCTLLGIPVEHINDCPRYYPITFRAEELDPVSDAEVVALNKLMLTHPYTILGPIFQKNHEHMDYDKRLEYFLERDVGIRMPKLAPRGLPRAAKR